MTALTTNHLKLITLWNNSKKLHRFSMEETLHVIHCRECLSLLGLCEASESLPELEQRVINRKGKQKETAPPVS
jgi:hypothetical protein